MHRVWLPATVDATVSNKISLTAIRVLLATTRWRGVQWFCQCSAGAAAAVVGGLARRVPVECGPVRLSLPRGTFNAIVMLLYLNHCTRIRIHNQTILYSQLIYQKIYGFYGFHDGYSPWMDKAIYHPTTLELRRSVMDNLI